MERWQFISDYPKYEVSTFGNVRHIKHKRILRGGMPYNGYRQVRVFNNGTGISKCIHQLVALTFLGPKPEGYEVAHKDNNRTNNQLSNLEYIPWQENRHGNHPIKETCPVCQRIFEKPFSGLKKHCSRKCLGHWMYEEYGFGRWGTLKEQVNNRRKSNGKETVCGN